MFLFCFYFVDNLFNIPNLQEEVLKLDSSDAFNYAVLGATTIGHELCHAFDSSGAQYGPDGKSLEWWTISDKRLRMTFRNELGMTRGALA